MSSRPFTVTIPQYRLDDLKTRLTRTRLPHDYANEDWSYGTNGEALRELVDYWRGEYDWRAQEERINAFDHYRTQIDGLPVHYIHARGHGPSPMPLILSHGWPWTFWDMHKIIGPLSDPAAYGGDPADAFEVIVPSMPGFGFSSPLQRTGINFWSTADLWHTLMHKELGFGKFAAAGGDWGALTTLQLGHKYAEDLHAIHVSTLAPLTLFGHERPWDVTGGLMAPPHFSAEERSAFLSWQERIASHVCVQVLDPQTLAYGLHDSPVGLLAWLLERRRSWGDTREGLTTAFDRDFLLTTASLYWFTDTFVTSARFYAEAARNPWQPSHDREPAVEAPVGISHFTHDGTVGLGAGLESGLPVVFEGRHDQGGHFAHYEAPNAIIADIRETLRRYRQ